MLCVIISSVLMLLFQDHVACPNFILTGPQQGQLVDGRQGRGDREGDEEGEGMGGVGVGVEVWGLK